eukprot:GDKI01032252.1.p1 GENE.GDKI01032252.1~~GDKI01032252.1.p1  ORF type:complete len:284 (+),score=78.55 GDKI01032252.1:257-1108(+)
MANAVYEVPQFVVDKNEAEFQAKSLQYESALSNLHIVLIVDHSGSMSCTDNYPHAGQKAPPGYNGGWTRWDNTLMVAKYLAKTMFVYDKNGSIPIVLYGMDPTEVVVNHPDDMYALFMKYKPSGNEDLKAALEFAFDRHIPKEHTGGDRTLFIVLHDGAATDPLGTKRVIKERLSDVDPKGEWLNVLFICMGDDRSAINFLKDLDECAEIGGNVDTKLDNEVYQYGPKNLLLNAIFEHLEKGGGPGMPVAPTPYASAHTAPTTAAAPAAGTGKSGSDRCCVVM